MSEQGGSAGPRRREVCRRSARVSRAALELVVARIVDCLLTAFRVVVGSDVADGAVEATGVVVLDEAGDEAAGLLQGGGRGQADYVALDRLVVALDLPPLWRSWTVGSRARSVRGSPR